MLPALRKTINTHQLRRKAGSKAAVSTARKAPDIDVLDDSDNLRRFLTHENFLSLMYITHPDPVAIEDATTRQYNGAEQSGNRPPKRKLSTSDDNQTASVKRGYFQAANTTDTKNL
jgi:hypothetical protein